MVSFGPIRLSPLEEAILLWQQASVPWNSQIDVTAPRLDAERVRAAWNAALAHHPLAACAIHEDGRGRFFWVREGTPDIGPVEVVECPDGTALYRLRVSRLDEPLPVDRAPLIRTVIARCPDRDVLVSCVSHVMCDGLSLFRLLRSVARAYAGEHDPAPAVDIPTAHRMLAEPSPVAVTDWADRWSARMSFAAAALAPRSRIAPEGGSPLAGFGLVNRTVDAGSVAAARRGLQGSFDAYAMAALHVYIERWNQERGAPTQRVGVTQGVNLRPDEWWDDVVVNLAAFSSVVTQPGDRSTIATALDAIAPQLEHAARAGHARQIASVARMARLVPPAVRRRVIGAASADQFDTCVISNAGVITDLPRFDVGDAPEIWASTPAMPEVGFAIGLYTIRDRLQFSVRYRTERFDEKGAAAFVDGYVSLLLQGA